MEHFQQSQEACSKLKELQESLNLPQHNLIQDVPTHWVSTFLMLERLFEQKRAITTYVDQHDIPTLATFQWVLLENLLQVLKPLTDTVQEANKEMEKISYIIPATNTLVSYLSKRHKDEGVQTIKDELKKSVEKRLLGASGSVNVFSDKNYIIATVLDPRFRTKFVRDETEATELVLQEMVFSTLTDDTKSKAEENISTSLNEETTNKDIRQYFDETAQNKQGDAHGTSGSADETTKTITVKLETPEVKISTENKTELDHYLAGRLLPRKDDPVVWWKKKITRYPKLKPLVLKYLSCPSSSVSSEKSFSAASLVYTENKNKLAPQTVEKLLFIMKNKKYVEPDDDNNTDHGKQCYNPSPFNKLQQLLSQPPATGATTNHVPDTDSDTSPGAADTHCPSLATQHTKEPSKPSPLSQDLSANPTRESEQTTIASLMNSASLDSSPEGVAYSVL